MSYLYTKGCDRFLMSHFDFLESLEDDEQKKFHGMFMGVDCDFEAFSGIMHMPLKECIHDMECLYYKEIAYIDGHFPTCRSGIAFSLWMKDNHVDASKIAKLTSAKESSIRAWLSAAEHCKNHCYKEKCWCLRDMTMKDGTIAWKRRMKFDCLGGEDS